MSGNSSSTAKVSLRIAKAIVSARTMILLFFTAFSILAGYYSTQFKIDASAETLLVKNNKLFIQTQVANQQFSPEEFILLAYKPHEHKLLSQRTFEDLTKLRKELLKISRVKSVTSILTVPLLDSDTSLITNDVAELTWNEQQYSPQKMGDLLDDHPIFTDLLINSDQTSTALQIVFESNPELAEIESEILALQRITLERDLSDDEVVQIAQLRAEADPIKQSLVELRKKEIEQIQAIANSISDATLYMGGSYVVGYHLVNIIQSDLMVFGSAITLIIILLLALIYRTVRWVIFPIVICAISVLLTMGLFGFLDLRTTVISANFIALQLILTLAVMIHLIGAYRAAAAKLNQADARDIVVAMLNKKLAPCFYATLTTSVGFGSLIFAGIQPVVDFGTMMLLAMLITMSVSLLLFPAMLAFLGRARTSSENKGIQSLLSKLASLSNDHPIKTTISVGAVFIFLSLGVSQLTVENSFIHYFDDETQIFKELSFIDQEFGGSTPLDIIVDIPDSQDKQDLIITADAINKLHLVHATVDAFPATGSVTSVINFTTLAKRINDGKPLTEYELDVVYSMLDDKVADQLLGAYLDEGSSRYRIAARIQDTNEELNRSEFMIDLRKDLIAVGLTPEQFQLTNLFVLYQDILSRLVDSQVTTLGIVYLALLIVLLFIFKSLKIALIALVPNILTTLGIVGVIGWLGIPLDLMTITIAAIAMGIAMDDTIHFVDNVISTSSSSTLEDAFMESGLAIIYTSLVIAVGFSLFVFSDFLPSVYFGVLTATAMMFALLTDLTILPALLKRFVLLEEPNHA